MIGVIGYLCLDLCPQFLTDADFSYNPGALLEVGPTKAQLGGVVGNTGGTVARLGLPCRLRGVIGPDVFGSSIREALQPLVSSKCELALELMQDSSSAMTIVLNPPKQDRMFLVNTGANAVMGADQFGPDFRKGLRILHYGYPNLCENMSKNAGAETRRLYEACHRDGILTSLDMALPSPGTWSYDYDWIAFLKNVLPVTDLFCPSIDELRFMLKMPTEAPQDLLDCLLGFGAKALFLKLGSEGSIIRTANNDETVAAFAPFGNGENWRGVNHYVKSRKLERIYGTTGAGDSSIAGVLAGIYLGKSAAESGELGARTAEQAISNPNGLAGVTPIV